MQTLRSGAAQVVVAAVLALATIAVAQAQEQNRQQGRRGGFGFGGRDSMGKVGLLQVPQVREELKLSAEQQQKLEERLRQMNEDLRALVPEGTPREEYFQVMQQKQDEVRQISSAADKDVDQILNKEQLERLKGISIQVVGVALLASDELASELNLKPEQKDQIKQVVEAGQRETLETLRAAREQGNFEQVREKMQKVREDMQQKGLAVLTAEQKQKWEQLKGQPFELQRGGGRPQQN